MVIHLKTGCSPSQTQCFVHKYVSYPLDHYYTHHQSYYIENKATESLKKKLAPAKRSLDFSGPVTKPSPEQLSPINKENINGYNISLTPSIQALDNVLTPANNLSNKRTAEDLFGDIRDIDFDDVQLPSKRQKTEEETDFDLINKIIEERKIRQMLNEPNRRLPHFRPIYDLKENLSLNIPRWAFLPLTNLDGDRFYVKLESEENWDKSIETNMQPSLSALYANTWAEARKILEIKQEKKAASEQPSSQPLPDMEQQFESTRLWVDKYRPHSYLDLLSEEPVNRALLHWLHLWDKVVFKKEVKTKEHQQRTTFSKRAGQFQLTNKWKGKKEMEPEMDPDGRPHHKVALLCGPPGVGKTTLAHLLARLAGYRPVELNASDERSTDAFRTAIQSATLMRSVIDAEKRPNCLVLDEIDGAPLPTVELLVRWCTATTESGKKKAKTQPLRRPIIAICNDLYASSLRPLRPIALVIQVGGVSIPRLASRLARVAECEGLTIQPHVLTSLATRAQGDVRAAIHVLSFIKARARSQVKMEDVEKASIGTKDCSKSIMQALQAIFAVNDKDPNAVMKILQAAGEYDRVADGVFENYITARCDARLHIACSTLSWLRFYDLVNSWTMRNQNYSLYGALPLSLLQCHKILASRTQQRIKFPTQAHEMYRKKLELDSISHSVWRGCSASVMTTRTALQLDVLPLLPYLLSLSLRSANVQLCSENERKTLRTCAGAMCDYGLQYIQQRTQEGLYAFVLEPDVYKVAFYGNEEKLRPPPAIRQALAREQQLELIRRNEEMANRVSNPNKPPSASQDKPKPTSSKTDEMKKPLPNHMQRLKPKEIEKATPQVHKDFFGRVVPLSQMHKQDSVADVISSSSVFYHYQEGFNNAVRRNVRTKDLL